MAITRRDVLKTFAYLGGTTAMTAAMAAFGWLKIPRAAAQELPRFHGLPTAGRRVAVIGAGVAGLTAAYEMAKAGFEVTVFEADTRYGGRSLTVRPTDPAYKAAYLEKKVVPSSFVTEASYVSAFREVDGEEQRGDFAVVDPAKPGAPFIDLYLNAGPGRIPLHHTGVLHYCNLFGVKLEPYVFRTEANLMRSRLLNGGSPVQIRQYRNNLQGHLAEILANSSSMLARGDRPLKPDELKMFRQMLTAYGDLDRTVSGQYVYINPNLPGRYSRPGYLREPYAGPYDGITPQILSFDEIVNSGLWNQLVNDTQLYWQASLLQPTGGMDMIWQAFLDQDLPGGRKLRDSVHLGRRVVAIDRAEGDRAEGDRAEGGSPLLIRFAGGGADRFDYVISTASPKVMAGFEPSSAFRPRLLDDLRKVRYEFGGKYGWQGRSRFWEKENQIFGGISWVDTLIEQIWYPSYGYNDWSGIMTGGYIHNAVLVDIDGRPIDPNTPPEVQHATIWGNLSQEQRRKAALEGGELLHPGFAQKVYADAGVSISWEKMPHQYGITGVFDFTSQLPLYNSLIGPADGAGRVWLAGDWLSFWAGWQEGSIRSAWYAMDGIARHLAESARAPVPATAR